MTRQEIKKCLNVAYKFNDTIFTNTQEMVDAIEKLTDFAQKALECVPEKDSCPSCGKKMTLHKSTFEQYEPSIYDCSCGLNISVSCMKTANVVREQVKKRLGLG